MVYTYSKYRGNKSGPGLIRTDKQKTICWYLPVSDHFLVFSSYESKYSQLDCQLWFKNEEAICQVICLPFKKCNLFIG